MNVLLSALLFCSLPLAPTATAWLLADGLPGPEPRDLDLHNNNDPLNAAPLVSMPLTSVTNPGFTVPSTETSSPTATGTITISSATTTTTASVGSSLTSVASTTTAINPTGTTGSLSGLTSTAGPSATATQGSGGAAGRGKDRSKVALVVALGVGVAGLVGL